MRSFAQEKKQHRRPVSSNLARSHTTTPGLHHRADLIPHLQDTIGSQVVQRILQTHAEEPKAGLTEAASRFGHDFSRTPTHSTAAGAIQTKLAINKPGDEYEQEANRVAEQVMRMPEPRLQRACACGGGCPKCQAEKLAQGHERLQTKHAGSGDLGQTAVPPIVDEVLSAPGRPLDTAARAFMESRFGHDFSRVRVYANGEAATAANAIRARAYTIGSDIVFGPNEYAPATMEGRRLLAHELVHVVQQHSRAAPMIARQEASFSEKWNVVWHVGALAGYRAKQLAAEALTAARQTGLPGIHNGPADAWRHCYWNCRMTAVIGKDDAAFIAENHEEQEEDNPTAERMMDTWNNKEGRDCAEPEPVAGSGAPPKDDYATAAAKLAAAQKRPAVDCDSCCQQKLAAGKLLILEDLGGGRWGGKVQSSKSTPRAGAPSVEKYEKY